MEIVEQGAKRYTAEREAIDHYLNTHNFSCEIKGMMVGLEENKQKEIIRYVQDKVSESYRDGIEAGKNPKRKFDRKDRQFDLKHGLFRVVRQKNGIDSSHPLYGVEMWALQKIRRENPGAQFVFLSERNAPITDSAFRKMLYRTGETAKLGLPVPPHMLRHSCGFKLANDGRDTRSIQYYLGHKNIQNTVSCTQISPSRFKGFWKD